MVVIKQDYHHFFGHQIQKENNPNQDKNLQNALISIFALIFYAMRLANHKFLIKIINLSYYLFFYTLQFLSSAF